MNNNEYAIYTSGKFTNPAMLDMNPRDGVVFCSNNHTPYIGTGIYRIVHKGLDKRQKPFAVAEPVFDLPVDCDEFFKAVLDILDTLSWLRPEGTIPQRQVRFNSYFNRRLTQEVTIEDIIEALKTTTPFELDKIFGTPIVKNGVDFEILHAFNRQYKAGHQVQIRYVTGEIEFQTVGWVYKNREHLVNSSIVVYGNTVDNLLVEFIPAKEEPAV